MKKFLSDISENEKSRILSLHEDYKGNLWSKILKEQSELPKVQGSNDFTKQNALCITRYCNNENGNAVCTEGMKQDFEIVLSSTDENRGIASDTVARNYIENTKLGLGPGTRASDVATLTSQIKKERSNSVKLYQTISEACKKGNKDACCAVANLANEVRIAETNAKSGGDRKPVLIITSAEQIAEPTQGSTEKLEVFDPKIPFNQTFDNNSSVVKEDFKAKIKEYLTSIIQRYNKKPISTLSIETSASRYRNTGEAANLSFLELSQQRAEAAKNSFMEIANSLGFDTKNTQVTINAKGKNGDGSSGPNPPEPNPYVDGGDVKMNTTPTKPRNEFGEPLAGPEDYEQFKYCVVKFTIPPAEVEIPGTAGIWEVSFFFYSPKVWTQQEKGSVGFFNKVKKYIKGVVS
jgi:outer membrane protein OmpA-like peptidoglycan-associated protein